jgi:adenylate cyclase
MMLHLFLALLADGHRPAGRMEAALAAVEDGLLQVDQTNQFYEAELHRLKGEFLLTLGSTRATEAETSLRKALSIARHQHARTLESRARFLSRLRGENPTQGVGR